MAHKNERAKEGAGVANGETGPRSKDQTKASETLDVDLAEILAILEEVDEDLQRSAESREEAKEKIEAATKQYH